jgi:hypothetical protein
VKNVVWTDLGYGDPFVLGQVLVENTRLRSLLDSESTVIRLTSGQSAECLSSRGQNLSRAQLVEISAQRTF